ncbi:hypothetical protein HYD27_19445 [Paenibacillus sp. S150]|nr:hypothetical protein [Paenibacillus sp. S150]
MVKASIAGEDFDNTKIVDFQIESSIVSGEEFEIGTAIPAKLTIKLRTAEEIPANARVIPYLALSLARMTWNEANIAWDDNPLPWVGGATEWMPLGEYFVDSRQKVNDVWVYTCYDKLVFGDAPYVSALTYPTTQQAVLDEICGLLGYTYDSSVVINPAYMVPVAPPGFSKRQVLSYIAGANSGSFYWGKAGVLRMKRFTASDTPVFTHTTSDYIRAKQLNPPKSYSRIVVTYDTEDDLTYEAGSGDENHTLYLENPLATQAIADALHASLGGISYLPLEMDSRAFPQLDIGDKIGFGLYEGSSWMEAFSPWMNTEIPWTGVLQYESYILHSTMIFKGGLQLKLKAPSISEQKSEFEVPGTLTEAVNKLDKTAVKEGKRYYGTTITRTEGIVGTVEGDSAKVVLNADELTFYAGSDRALWFDLPSHRFKFNGTLEAVDGIFSGKLLGGEIEIGSGENVFKADNSGIWSGAQNFVEAPFRVNMAGQMEAEDGRFKGIIEASDILGGEIIGAQFFTDEPGLYPRVEIDPYSIAFGVYSAENSGIQIPAFAGGVSRIIFLADGSQSTIYSSPTLGLAITSFGRMSLGGTYIDLFPQPGGNVNVPSWSQFYSNGSSTSLQGELNAIWTALAGKANASHSHTVTIPNHNHGNPDNLNGGGGTFTAS